MTKVATKKVVLKREILGVKLSKKLPNEMKATIKVIENNNGKTNVPFDTLFNEFVNEMKKISNSKSNLKTRFRRILYRNLEGIVLKNSIQSAKFNLKANIKGLQVKTKTPIQFKDNGDAITKSVDENFFSFKVLKKVSTIDKLELDAKILERVNNFKATV